jgi:lantibiotic modifying enzyme
MRAWCHGAPGIGLGRLAMLDRAGDSTMCGEIQAALMTTTRQRTTAPGLLTGLAGIGYGLLRIALPERVPSVLSLEPPKR